MDAKTCTEVVPHYADLISEVSRLSTYASSVQAIDRPEAVKIGPSYDAAKALADGYAGTAAHACPQGTRFEELIAASQQFGATQGRWQAYGHNAAKTTPAHPNAAYTRTVQQNYTATVNAAGRRRWNAITAIAEQPISSGGMKPKL